MPAGNATNSNSSSALGSSPLSIRERRSKNWTRLFYQQYLLSNRNIAEGKNPHIKFKKNGGFILSTPKQEESDAEPLQQYFPDRRFVPLVEVLATVNRFTHYVDELQHPQQRYQHGKPSEAAIYAE